MTRPGRPLRGLVALGLLVLQAAAPSAQGPGPDATDGDLGRASAGRDVRVAPRGSSGPVAGVPLETYVARVLAGEGEPGAPEAAQQALAIAIRTFAVFNARRHEGEGFDLCDSTHCQVLRAATSATRRAALATAGQILTWRGQPAEIFYSASCGGRSESADELWPQLRLPYLRSAADDVHDQDAPWTLERTLAEVEDALARVGAAGRLTDVRVDARNASGRVARLRLDGVAPEVMTGDRFRLALGPAELKSTAFTVSRQGDRLRFSGRGYGHAVGAAVPVATTRVVVRVPRGGAVRADEVERLAELAHAELSMRLGTSVAPLTITLHPSLDEFRAATGQPWWVSAVTRGASVDLAPAEVLAQRDGLEPAVRRAVAEVLVAPAFDGRPAWLRVGAGRYFARSAPGPVPAADARVRCPSDAELTAAVSAVAQREAEARAEACFAHAVSQAGDWRAAR